jgi:hypothetical protein
LTSYFILNNSFRKGQLITELICLISVYPFAILISPILYIIWVKKIKIKKNFKNNKFSKFKKYFNILFFFIRFIKINSG